jgi:putative two-component system response regulator
MTVPMRASSIDSAMMPTSMEALAGIALLLAGDDQETVAALRAWVALGGATARASGADPEEVAAAVASQPPDVVLVLGGNPEALSSRLDPLGLELGPPVVPLTDVISPGEAPGPAAARRLRAFVARSAQRLRMRELESILATQALARRRDIDAAQLDALHRLALVAEYRDDNTADHTERVGELAAQLARKLGLADRAVWLIRRAAPLHDLGKIAVPDNILLKPGRLTDEEFEVVKTHAVLGARVLAGAEAEVTQMAERIAHHHHERWDGTGYPDALGGDDIPVEAQLVHVADVFDVLVHERPYKESWTVEAAAEEIRRGAGTQFAPAAVEAFEALGPAVWRATPVG